MRRNNRLNRIVESILSLLFMAGVFYMLWCMAHSDH